MATQAELIAELQQTTEDLQSALDAKQDQIATKLAADKQTIADLQAIIDNGDGTNNAALEAVIASLKASTADLAATPTE